jgi:hypothetical protein
MPKNSITDYDSTPSNNTDIGGIDIQGTAPVSNINDALQTMMSHLKNDVFDMDNMVEGSDTKILTADERTKLSNIEASADVTDNTNVEAALASERLGTVAKSITDWDDATENGFYYGNNAANSPTSADYMGLVLAHDADWIVQEVTLFTSTASANTESYRREKDDGTWTSWYRIYKSATEIQELAPSDPFVVFNGSTGAIIESNKVSSLSKTGTGKYTVTFEAGAFANANYMGAGSARKNDANDDANMAVQTGGTTSLVQTTTTGYIRVSYNITSTFVDSALVGVYYFGGQ